VAPLPFARRFATSGGDAATDSSDGMTSNGDAAMDALAPDGAG